MKKKVGDLYWTMIQSGQDIPAIAQELGVLEASVRNAIRRSGHRLSEPDDGQVRHRYGFYISSRLDQAIESIGRDKLMEGLQLLQSNPSMRRDQGFSSSDEKITRFFRLSEAEKQRLNQAEKDWGYRSQSGLVRDAIEALITSRQLSEFYRPPGWKEEPKSPWALDEPTVQVPLRLPLWLWNRISHLKRPRGHAHEGGLDVSRFLREAIDSCFFDSLGKYVPDAPDRLGDDFEVRGYTMALIYQRQKEELDRVGEELDWNQQEVLGAIVHQAIALGAVPDFSPNPAYKNPTKKVWSFWHLFRATKSLHAVAAQFDIPVVQVADKLIKEGFIEMSDAQKDRLIQEAIATAK